MALTPSRTQELDEERLSSQWFEPFGRLLLSSAPVDDESGTVLDVMCGSGIVARALVDRLDTRGRVVALDPSTPLLDVARRRAGTLVGKRLFFRHERPERLSFTGDVFDLVISNAGVLELPDPDQSLAECVRVTKPGGALAMTMSLRGTFQEFLDLLREVLERHEWEGLLDRLDQHIRSYPSDNEAIARFEGLGLRDVHLTRSSFVVSFPSGHDFMESSLVNFRFREAWTQLIAGADSKRVFHEVVSTVDTYFGIEPFELTVQAACVVGRKPEEGEGLLDYESVAAPESGPATTPQDPKKFAAAAAHLQGDEITPVRAVEIPVEASGANGSHPAAENPSSKDG